MQDGFIRVAAVTPEVIVGDVEENARRIFSYMEQAEKKHVKITVFPELCLSGYTCQDLFLQDTLLQKSMMYLLKLAEKTAEMDGLFFVGLPFECSGKIYNVAAALNHGRVLGLIPKQNLPNYGEFYEARQFTPGKGQVREVSLLNGEKIPFGANQLFVTEAMPKLCVAAELCEDLWTPNPPSIAHVLHGANVIVNLSASNEVTGKNVYRRELVKTQSAHLYCGYIYASAGKEESTQDLVYSGHNLICEAGRVLQESPLFSEGIWISELDIQNLNAKRRMMTTFPSEPAEEYVVSSFQIKKEITKLTRKIEPLPFVPADPATLQTRCEEILSIQAMGLKKRLSHTGAKTAVIGISGGLDSTLALLVTVRAFDSLSLNRKGILAVTMPGFGTTDRTYDNAVAMVKELGVTLKEISISEAVLLHFKDIGQNPEKQDVTYENAQARERTQILMDIANKEGGLVIGTGDLSELALGWATYNGDHMSMYAVNASVPKTLVRHLVRFYADKRTSAEESLKEVLKDVLDTPVSPELLPPKEGKIAQKTEELVGPYELHDFFLYYLMREFCSPKKIYRLAKEAFAGVYTDETILKWLETFYRRFFMQQFKRSCLPDGPKVGTVALSPRGDLRMPSDASAKIWLHEIEEIKSGK